MLKDGTYLHILTSISIMSISQSLWKITEICHFICKLEANRTASSTNNNWDYS